MDLGSQATGVIARNGSSGRHSWLDVYAGTALGIGAGEQRGASSGQLRDLHVVAIYR